MGGSKLLIWVYLPRLFQRITRFATWPILPPPEQLQLLPEQAEEFTARRTEADQLANLILIEIQSPMPSHIMSFRRSNLQMRSRGNTKPAAVALHGLPSRSLSQNPPTKLQPLFIEAHRQMPACPVACPFDGASPPTLVFGRLRGHAFVLELAALALS